MLLNDCGKSDHSSLIKDEFGVLICDLKRG